MPDRNKIPTLWNLFLTFFKVGCFTFGGGFAMIPIIQKEIVDRYRWMAAEEFLDMIAVTQSAPGPVAINSAVFTGYKLRGIRGSLASLAGTVLPSFLIILVFAIFIASQRDTAILGEFFSGVRPAVVALILGAGLNMGRKSLRRPLDFILAVLTLGALLWFSIHPVALILLGASVGIAAYRFGDSAKRGES